MSGTKIKLHKVLCLHQLFVDSLYLTFNLIEFFEIKWINKQTFITSCIKNSRQYMVCHKTRNQLRLQVIYRRFIAHSSQNIENNAHCKTKQTESQKISTCIGMRKLWVYLHTPCPKILLQIVHKNIASCTLCSRVDSFQEIISTENSISINFYNYLNQY